MAKETIIKKITMFPKSKFLSLIIVLIIAVAIVVFVYFVKPNTGSAPTISASFTWHIDKKDMPPEIKQKYEEKKKECQDKIAEGEDLAQNYFELGNMEKNLGNLKEAIEAYNQSIAKQDGALARNNLADTFAEAGDYADAEKNYRKAIEINPSNAAYWRKLTDFIYEKFPERRSEIKSIYLDALDNVEETHRIDIITVFARHLDNMGDYKESLRWWQQALILSPNNESIKAEVDALNKKLSEQK